MKRIASTVGAIAVLCSGNVFAATVSGAVTLSSVEIDGGPVNDVNFDNIPQTFLTFNTAPSGKPACGNSTTSNSPYGLLAGNNDQVKAMASLATAALLAGKSVRIIWSGTCALRSQYATVVGIIVSQ